MSASIIAPCVCGQEPPYVWLYSQHDPLAGTVVWHVFCKSCRAEVVRGTKRQALSAWAHEYVVHLGMTVCAVCRKPACDHSDLAFAGIIPARALHGSGHLAQTEVNTPAASVCALSPRVHADTSTSQEQHNHG